VPECGRSWDVLRYFNPELRPGLLAASEARRDPESGQESEPAGVSGANESIPSPPHRAGTILRE